MKKIITFSILLLSILAGSLYSADHDKEGNAGKQRSSYPSGSGSGGRAGASAYPSGSGSGGASLVSMP